MRMKALRIVQGIQNALTHRIRFNLWRVHPLRFSPYLNKIPIDRPIFLLGVQGGGLTLLARMLHRHPQAVYVTGNHRWWAGPDEMQNVMGPILPPELTGLHHKIPPHPAYPHRDWLYAIDDLLPLYRRRAQDATPEMAWQFQRAIRLAIGMYAPNPQQARFVDKSQSFTVRLSLVNALLAPYHPRFILVTRNPYAMVYRAATRVASIQQAASSLEDRLRLAAQHWANSFRCALEDAPEVEYFTVVRFEDLLKEPERWLREICDFVGFSFEPDMIPAPEHRIPLGSTGSSRGDHKWYPLRPDVNQPYLRALEPWMIELIDAAAGDLARRWAYTPEGP